MSRNGPAEPRIAWGIAAMLVAMSSFSVMDALIKHLSEEFHTAQIFFFRVAFALMPALVMVRAEGGPAVLRTRRLPLHALRSVLTTGALICLFFAFSRIPLADAYAIAFAAPLFVTALSRPMLGERVGLRRWSAVLVGFCGVLVILRPGGGLLSAGGLMALAGTVMLSIAVVQTRLLTRTDGNAAIVFYFSVIGTLLSATALPFVWVTPDVEGGLMLFTVGIVGGIGQWFLTEAFRQAPAAVVSPFQYIQLFWGLLFGYLFFGDSADTLVLVGAAIVIGSGLFVLLVETRSGGAVGSGRGGCHMASEQTGPRRLRHRR